MSVEHHLRASHTYQSTQEVYEHEESHGETAEAEHVGQENEFAQVVDSGVDPTTTLREQNAPRLGSDSVSDGRSEELRAERREVLQQQRRQETIFTEGEQVLLVQRVDVGLGVLLYDAVRDDDGATLVGGPDAVH